MYLNSQRLCINKISNCLVLNVVDERYALEGKSPSQYVKTENGTHFLVESYDALEMKYRISPSDIFIQIKINP